MRVTFRVDTHSYHNGDAEPNPNNEPYMWRGTERTEIHQIIAYESPDAEESTTEWGSGESFTRELDVEHGDTVYGVVAQFSTGDTFGRSDGEVAVMDVFKTLDSAQQLVATLSGEDKPDGRGRTEFAREHINGRKYWMPWVGYFETLEDLSIHAVRVNDDGPARVRYW